MRIYEVNTPKLLKEFIMFPFNLYKEDPYWVPPLISDAKKIAQGNTPLFKRGPYTHFIVKDKGKVLGRITCGIDKFFNETKGAKETYFTLFEAVNDKKVVNLLFSEVEKYAKKRNMTQIKGPISPTNGDDFRGLLVKNFETSPSLLESYNPSYYKNFIEELGYKTYYEFYSYIFHLEKLDLRRYENGTRYAMDKYGFTIQAINPKEINKVIYDLKYVMDHAIPDDWLDPIIPPTIEEIKETAKELKPLGVPGSLIMAYSKKGEPIGFNVSLPNYNEVLKRLNGHIFPFGWLKFLYYKKRIKSAKSFIMFVIPSWHKKGVSSSIYLKGLKFAKQYGYKWVEGGTIGKDNLSMRNDAEKLGGIHYKTFRLYIKYLQN